MKNKKSNRRRWDDEDEVVDLRNQKPKREPNNWKKYLENVDEDDDYYDPYLR